MTYIRMKPEAAQAAITRLWGTASAGAIGNRCGMTAADVTKLAAKLGLPPSTYDQPHIGPKPGFPRGWDAATVAWARGGTGPEERLILGTLGEWPGCKADGAAKGVAG